VVSTLGVPLSFPYLSLSNTHIHSLLHMLSTYSISFSFWFQYQLVWISAIVHIQRDSCLIFLYVVVCCSIREFLLSLSLSYIHKHIQFYFLLLFFNRFRHKKETQKYERKLEGEYYNKLRFFHRKKMEFLRIFKLFYIFHLSKNHNCLLPKKDVRLTFVVMTQNTAWNFQESIRQSLLRPTN